MTKDKELEKLFSTAVTSFGDNEKFTAELSGNLDKIECVKRLYEEKRRQYRVRIALSFVVGMVSAALAVIVYPLLPADAALTDILVHSGVLLLAGGQTKFISCLLFCLLFTFLLSVPLLLVDNKESRP